VITPGSFDVGMVDTGIGTNETSLVLDDDRSRTGSQYFRTLSEDHFDQFRSFIQKGGYFNCLRCGNDGCQVDQPSFRLGNDLLRQNQHIAIHKYHFTVCCRLVNDLCQVVTFLDERNSSYSAECDLFWLAHSIPVIRIPDEGTLYFIFRPMSIDVIPSTTTVFSITPASQAFKPISSAKPITISRDSLLPPATKTSHSISSPDNRCSKAIVWKASTTCTSGPNIALACNAALPSGGICTLLTFGGTR